MKKEEILKRHPAEVKILLEIYKRSITHIEGYEKITWATSFQISECIEAMNVFTAKLREELEFEKIHHNNERRLKESCELALLKRDEQIQSLSSRVAELEEENKKLNSEAHIIEKLNHMCIQSLSPEKLEMWEEVRTWLDINRNINPII